MNYFTRKELLRWRQKQLEGEIQYHIELMASTIKTMQSRKDKLIKDWQSILNEAQALAEENDEKFIEELTHVDGSFCYHVKCAKCGTIYMLNGHVELIELTEPENDLPILESSNE